MKRKDFLRNIILGVAASLLPKIVQPMDVGGQCVFDVKRINKRLEELRQYPLGVNECVGSCYDRKNSKTFYFVHNSNGEHGIYSFDVARNKTEKVMQNQIHSFCINKQKIKH